MDLTKWFVEYRPLRSLLWFLTQAECYDLASGEFMLAEQLYGKIELRVLLQLPDKEASKRSIAKNLKCKDFSEWELMEYCRELDEAASWQMAPWLITVRTFARSSAVQGTGSARP